MSNTQSNKIPEIPNKENLSKRVHELLEDAEVEHLEELKRLILENRSDNGYRLLDVRGSIADLISKSRACDRHEFWRKLFYSLAHAMSFNNHRTVSALLPEFAFDVFADPGETPFKEPYLENATERMIHEVLSGLNNALSLLGDTRKVELVGDEKPGVREMSDADYTAERDEIWRGCPAVEYTGPSEV